MSDKVDGRIALLKPVRALFCNVLEARKFKKNGKEVGEAKHDMTVVLDADDLKAIQSKVIAVAKERWPNVDLKTLKFPFSRAEKQAEKAVKKGKDGSIYTPGTFLLSARSKFQPALSYLDGRTVVDITEANKSLSRSKFYNGCYVVPQINFVAFEGDDESGVCAYLDAVLWVKDGPRIGGGARSGADSFKDYVGTITGEDPTGGQELDDEIPF